MTNRSTSFFVCARCVFVGDGDCGVQLLWCIFIWVLCSAQIYQFSKKRTSSGLFLSLEPSNSIFTNDDCSNRCIFMSTYVYNRICATTLTIRRMYHVTPAQIAGHAGAKRLAPRSVDVVHAHKPTHTHTDKQCTLGKYAIADWVQVPRIPLFKVIMPLHAISEARIPVS